MVVIKKSNGRILFDALINAVKKNPPTDVLFILKKMKMNGRISEPEYAFLLSQIQEDYNQLKEIRKRQCKKRSAFDIDAQGKNRLLYYLECKRLKN